MHFINVIISALFIGYSNATLSLISGGERWGISCRRGYFATTLQARYSTSFDGDTFPSGLRITCTNFKTGDKEKITAFDTIIGGWEEPRSCKANEVVVAVQLKSRGSFHSKILCKAERELEKFTGPKMNESPGTCENGEALCGIYGTLITTDTLTDPSLENYNVKCCSAPPILFHSKKNRQKPSSQVFKITIGPPKARKLRIRKPIRRPAFENPSLHSRDFSLQLLINPKDPIKRDTKILKPIVHASEPEGFPVDEPFPPFPGGVYDNNELQVSKIEGSSADAVPISADIKENLDLLDADKLQLKGDGVKDSTKTTIGSQSEYDKVPTTIDEPSQDDDSQEPPIRINIDSDHNKQSTGMVGVNQEGLIKQSVDYRMVEHISPIQINDYEDPILPDTEEIKLNYTTEPLITPGQITELTEGDSSKKPSSQFFKTDPENTLLDIEILSSGKSEEIPEKNEYDFVPVYLLKQAKQIYRKSPCLWPRTIPQPSPVEPIEMDLRIEEVRSGKSLIPVLLIKLLEGKSFSRECFWPRLKRPRLLEKPTQLKPEFRVYTI